MSLLIISYLFNSLMLIILGGVFLKRYYNLGGVFFLIFCLSTSGWFIFFILSYFFTENLSVLELFIKITYYLSVITLYSFILFLVYFRKSSGVKNKWVLFLFSFIAFLLGGLYIYSPYIIDGLHFDLELQDWYENQGYLYLIHIFISILFIPLSMFIGVFRFKNSSPIDRKRLQYIFLGVFLFIVLSVLFLLILPALGVMKGQMDKYITFFFVPFILGVFYSIRRYDFLNFKIALVNIILFLYSLFVAYILVIILDIYSGYLNKDFRTYWGIQEAVTFVDITIAILVFLGVFYFSRMKLKIFFNESDFDSGLEQMKEEIPFIMNFNNLNRYLDISYKELFGINTAKIVLKDIEDYKNIKNYFTHNMNVSFIINDIVFLEENKKQLGKLFGILKNNFKETYIIFPLFDNNKKYQGILELGSKPLRDPFSTSELKSLITFTGFINAHLKYIDIYKQIQDLSINLDKKVDEKTIEYNKLLNKQKEFIAYVGHEIKNPITNTLFLSDSIKHDIKGKVDNDIQEDAGILYDELVKVSKLVKYIFSAEKFDLDKVSLYKNSINLSKFFHKEIHNFSHNYENIKFEGNIQGGVICEIDEIQFRQVVENLVSNSIKFIDTLNPKIIISLCKNKEGILITIEDNGKGFSMGEAESIFDKYVTGSGSATGLGMGLFLCKKIVELHGGKIIASKSQKLGGARFSIKL